jgi:ferredoxin-NADP reductase
MKATLVRIDTVTPRMKTFWFRPDRSVQYVAGQYTQAYLPHNQPDDRGDKRWFTLSSSPTEPLLGVTTKFAPQRSSTFKRTLRALAPGVQVQLAEPMGDFVLPKDATLPLLFVAGGAGITPVRSMIKYLTDRDEKRTVHLLHGASLGEELAFRPLFEGYKSLHYRPVVKASDQTWQGESGALTTELILQAAGALPGGLIYLSGPEVLVEKLDKELKEAGIAPERLVTDFFHGYSDV